MKRKASDKLDAPRSTNKAKPKTIKDLPLDIIREIADKSKKPVIFNSRTDIGPLAAEDLDLDITSRQAGRGWYSEEYELTRLMPHILRANEAGPITSYQRRLIDRKEFHQKQNAMRTEQLLLTAIFGKGHPVVENAINRSSNRLRFNDLDNPEQHDPDRY